MVGRMAPDPRRTTTVGKASDMPTATTFGPKMDENYWRDFYQLRGNQIKAGAANGLDVDATTGGVKGKLEGGAGGASGAAGGAGSSASSGLFGNLGDLSGTFNQFADQNIGRAKDWAQFQLGLNAQQGEQDYGFRSREATRDFGFNTALAGQQIEGNRSLESLRQNSETDRLQRSLTSQQTMQQSDFSNQTQQRAQQAALARLGFGGRI